MKKTLLLKFFLFALLLSVAGMATAQTFTSGNLNYSINSDGITVTITGLVDGTNAMGTLTIPSSVTYQSVAYAVTAIGNNAFSGFTNIYEIVCFVQTPPTVGSGAFNGWDKYNTTVNVPYGSKIAYNNIHWGGFSLFEVLAHENENLIYTLNEDGNLTLYGHKDGFSASGELHMVDSALYRGRYRHVVAIRDEAFEGCSGLSGTLTLPQTLETIGEWAFSGCTGLSGSLEIPNSVTSIGKAAFRTCEGLSGIQSLGEGLTTIGEAAFFFCTGLTGSLTIPDAVTTIADQAFYNCSNFNGALTLGNSLVAIGDNAFDNDGNFTNIVSRAIVPPTSGYHAFDSGNATIPVTVPCGSGTAYSNINWGGFSNFIDDCHNDNVVYAQYYPDANDPNSPYTVVYWDEEIADDFETGDFSKSPWQMDALHPWVICDTVSHSGTYCMQSGNIGQNSTASTMTVNVNIPHDGTISFFANISCEDGWDFGYFYIDGVRKESWTGEVNWTEYQYPVTAGQHTFLWKYEKDTQDADGDDCLCIDDIVFYRIAPPTVPFDPSAAPSTDLFDVYRAKADGTDLTLLAEDYDSRYYLDSTWTNLAGGNYKYGVTYANDTIFVWSDSLSKPISSFEVNATARPTNGGTVSGAGTYHRDSIATLTATPAAGYDFINWTLNGVEVSTDSVYSFTVTGGGNYVANFSPYLTFAKAIHYPDPEDLYSPEVMVHWGGQIVEDFESGDFSQFDWKNNPDYPWTITTNNPYEGSYCMKSGGAGVANVSSDMMVTVTVPADGTMSFYCKISCEKNWDYCYFFIDGVQKGAYTGEVDWCKREFSITAGIHTFLWRYQKDNTGDQYDDCFYVDYIAFYKNPEPAQPGWHTYCESDFSNSVGSNLTTTPSWGYEYPAEFLNTNYAGWQITKVSLFSDNMYNAVGGNYTCRIYVGGTQPAAGTMVSTITVDVPKGQNAWVDWDLTTPVNVTGNDPIWVVWTANTTVSSWPAGCCGNLNDLGTWWDGGNGWEHLTYGTWTMRNYFTNLRGRSVAVRAVPNHTFNVYRSNADTTNVTLIAKNLTVNSYIDTTWQHLDYGSYLYGVSAEDSTYIQWTNPIDLLEIPYPPMNLIAYDSTVFNDEQITISWDAVTGTSFQKYYVYRDGYKIDETTATTYTDGPLAYNMMGYDYYVTAVFAAGESAPSDTVNVQVSGYGNVNGHAFEQDGVTGIAGVTVTLTGNDEFGDSHTFEFTTNSNGYYNGQLYAGSYNCQASHNSYQAIGGPVQGNPVVIHYNQTTSPIDFIMENLWIENGVSISVLLNSADDPEGVHVVLTQDSIQASLNSMGDDELEIILDETGYYVWNLFRKGTYYVEISMEGYETIHDTVTISSNTAMMYVMTEILYSPKDVYVSRTGWAIWQPGDRHLEGYRVMLTDLNDHSLYTENVSTNALQLPTENLVDGTLYKLNVASIYSTGQSAYSVCNWLYTSCGHLEGFSGILGIASPAGVNLSWTYPGTTSIGEPMAVSLSRDGQWLGFVNGNSYYDAQGTINSQYEARMVYNGDTLCPDNNVYMSMSCLEVVTVVEDENTITATANPSSGGTIQGAGTYHYNETCTLTATPSTGYHFLNWSQGGTVVTTDETFTFTVTQDSAFVAQFEINNYEITATVDPLVGGTVTGAGDYDHFDTCTLVAAPAVGYHFVNWTQGGTEVGTSLTYQFEVTGAASFVANFEINSYDVTATANPTEGGTVTGAGTYTHGTTVTMTATPSTGYHFLNWSQGSTVVTTDETFTFAITQDTVFVANFEINSYDVTATANPTEGGTVTGAGTYTHGTTVTMTATPSSGYHFLNWSQGNTVITTDNTFTFEITQDTAFVANFEINSYDVTATANPTEGGTVTGAGTYDHFDTCTLVAAPAVGYHFVNWTQGGTEVSTSLTYQFEVTGAASFVANFEINSYDIVSYAYPSYGGNVTGAGVYLHGETCTLHASPSTGFRFQMWTKDQVIVSTNPEYSFVVTEAATYRAHFVREYYTISAEANPAEGGTITGTGDMFIYSSSCQLVATPNEGYAFVNWTRNGAVVSTEPIYNFTVTGPAHFVANFTRATYTITAEADPADGGTVTGAGTYTYGQTVTMTAVANNDFRFENWTEGEEVVSEEASFAFVATGNRHLVAHFINTVGVGETEGVQVTIYPNPATNRLFVECDAAVRQCDVYSITGSLLISLKDCTSRFEIGLDDLSSGTYIIRLTTDDGTQIKSFVKH